jgi:putative N-acetylmannosamine-6-phosphate epimerase
VCVETTRTNSNVRVEAVHELRKIREDYVIGIVGLFKRLPQERTNLK